MSENGERRHGLEPILGAAPAAADAGVSIVVQSDAGFVNLRGNPEDPVFVDAAAGVLGQELPLAANTFSTGKRRVYWLGPDEWLVVTDAADAAATTAQFDDAIPGLHAAVNDVSGGNVVLQLAGDGAREVLARGCTLDLHPDVFPVSACAQSGLAKASVLLGLLDETPAFEIIVRRSFSDYLCRWLTHSARSQGVRFSEAP